MTVPRPLAWFLRKPEAQLWSQRNFGPGFPISLGTGNIMAKKKKVPSLLQFLPILWFIFQEVKPLAAVRRTSFHAIYKIPRACSSTWILHSRARSSSALFLNACNDVGNTDWVEASHLYQTTSSLDNLSESGTKHRPLLDAFTFSRPERLVKQHPNHMPLLCRHQIVLKAPNLERSVNISFFLLLHGCT